MVLGDLQGQTGHTSSPSSNPTTFGLRQKTLERPVPPVSPTLTVSESNRPVRGLPRNFLPLPHSSPDRTDLISPTSHRSTGLKWYNQGFRRVSPENCKYRVLSTHPPHAGRVMTGGHRIRVTYGRDYLRSQLNGTGCTRRPESLDPV